MRFIRSIGYPPIRFYVTIFLCTGIFSPIYSQSENSKNYKFQIGLTSGVHLTQLKVQHQSAGTYSVVNNLNSDPNLSYHFGIPVTAAHNRFTLSVSLLFIKDKTQTAIRDDYNLTTLNQAFSFSWFALPLTFNYEFVQKSNHRFFVGMGIVPRRLLNAHSKVSQKFGTITIIGNKIDTSDIYKEWSIFGTAIVGTDLVIAKKFPLTLLLSVDQSLANLVTEPTHASLTFDYGFVQPKVNMNSISISVSYFLGRLIFSQKN